MPSWSCLRREPVVRGDNACWSRKSAQARPKVPSGSDHNRAKLTIVGTLRPCSSARRSINWKNLSTRGWEVGAAAWVCMFVFQMCSRDCHLNDAEANQRSPLSRSTSTNRTLNYPILEGCLPLNATAAVLVVFAVELASAHSIFAAAPRSVLLPSADGRLA